jgi:hypothetical protein
MLFYAYFMPQNRAMPKKCGLTVYSISHGCLIFAKIQVGGGGRAGGWGGEQLYLQNRAKIHSQQKRDCLLADCRPHRPLSTFYLNKRCSSIVYVDSKKCKQN